MLSLKQKLEKIHGLHGTSDLTEWENRFVESVYEKINDTTKLSEKQVEIIDRIHGKHFAC